MAGFSAPSPLARSRTALLGSCAVAAALIVAGPARAQVAATGTAVQGNVTFNTAGGVNPSQVTVQSGSNAINWTTTGAVTGGVTTFLPEGANLGFVSPNQSSYVVFNRINPAAGANAPIARIDGNVTSTISDLSKGGTIWFYSPGGIIAGANSVFDVGSLLLTANDLKVENGYGNGSVDLLGNQALSFNRANIRALPALNPRAKVLVESGASITASPANSYVAILAPRVEQNGDVRVNGSAAYVAAEDADLTFETGYGLFNINVRLGSTVDTAGETVLSHSGTTYGTGTGGSHGIYMVAVPKNDAISMLVSGGIGYDAADSAAVTDGIVVLSGGANIATPSGNIGGFTRTLATPNDGNTGTTNDPLQATTLRIGSGTIDWTLNAFATGAVRASGDPINGDATAALALTRGVTLESNGYVFLGDRDFALGGTTPNASLSLAPINEESNSPLTIRVSGRPAGPIATNFTTTPPLIGGVREAFGSARIEAASIQAASLNVTTSNAAAVNTGGDITANIGDLTLDEFGSITLDASGSNGGADGAGQGGNVIFNAGQIGAYGFNVYAYGSGRGTDTDGTGYSGTGGTITALLGSGTVNYLNFDAGGNGAAGGVMANGADGGAGGAGRGGTIDVTLNGTTVDGNAITLSADGFGGNGGDGMFGNVGPGPFDFGYGVGAAGGASSGGIVKLATNGAFLGDIEDGYGTSIRLNARSFGGYGGFSNIGSGVGGDAAIGLAGATLDGGIGQIGELRLDSSATGGNGSTGGDASYTGLFDPESPTRGSYLRITGGNNFTFGNYDSDPFAILSTATGGTATGFNGLGGSGGNAFGGIALLDVSGGATFTAKGAAPSLDVSAIGGNGGAGSTSRGGNGGDALGGLTSIHVGTGTSLTLASDFIGATVVQAGNGGAGSDSASSADGGAGGNGGFATGQFLRIRSEGDLTIASGEGGTDWNVSATGGTGGNGGSAAASGANSFVGGNGGNGNGGTVLALAQDGSIQFEGNVRINATGSYGDGGDGGTPFNEGEPYPGNGDFGNAQGGTIDLASNGQSGLIAGGDLSLYVAQDPDSDGFFFVTPGQIRLRTSSTREDGAFQFGELYADASGFQPGFAPAVRFEATNNLLDFSGGGTVYTAGTAEIEASGAGGVRFGGALQLNADDLSINHLLVPATPYSTLSAANITINTFAGFGSGDVAGNAGSVLTSTAGSINILAEGALSAGRLLGLTGVHARARGNITIGDAIVTQTQFGQDDPDGQIDIQAGFFQVASFGPPPGGGPFLAASDATITGQVSGPGDINLSAGRDVLIAGTARIAGDRSVNIDAADDVIASAGASIRAALAPVADPADTGARDLGGVDGLSITAGAINADEPSTFSSIVLNGTVSGGARPIFLQANAIDARGATFTGRSLIADITGAPTPTAQSATDTDGGILSAGCVRGNVCLGPVTVTNRFEVGGLATALPTAISLTGAVDAQVAILRAKGGLSFGTAGQTALVRGADLLRVEAQGGDVTLLGATTLQGGTVVGPNGGATSIIASGAINGAGSTILAGQALGIRAGTGSITLTSLRAGGAINTLAADGTVQTANQLSSGQDILISGLVQSGAGTTTFAANRNIALGAVTTLGGGATVRGGTGTATVSGAVSAAGNYSVTGTSVTLGSASAPSVAQNATGAVTISSTAGGIGANNVVLTSDSNNAGNEALTLSSTGGGIQFAATTTLLAGAQRGANLQIRTDSNANPLALGTVGARSLLGAIGTGAFATGVTRSGSISFGDVTLTGGNPAGNFVVNSGGAITTGSVTTAGDVLLTATGSLQTSGIVRGGDIALIGSTVQTAAVSADDDIVIRGTGDVTLGRLTGGLGADRGDQVLGGSSLVVGPNIVVRTGGTVTLTGVANGANGTLSVETTGLLRASGDVDSTDILFSSNDIAIDPAARIGLNAGLIQLANNGRSRSYFGGGDVAGSYSLSNTEFGRLSAATIELLGGVDFGYGAAGVTIGQLDIYGPNAAAAAAAAGRRVNLTNSDLSVFSGGDIQVTGAMRMTGAAPGDSISLTAQDRIDVVAPLGSIAILDTANNPAGSLSLVASEVRVGSANAIAALDDATVAEASTLLANNDTGVVSDAGWLQANEIDVRANTGIYIQNSGDSANASDPNARRGVTVGGGGFNTAANGGFGTDGIGTEAVADGFGLVVNGRQRNTDGSFVTGRDFAALVFDGYRVSEDGITLDPDSTVNGCRIDLTCGRVGAFQGTPTVVAGTVGIVRTDPLDTITIGSQTATIDWAPYDTDGTGAIDFLPVGRTGLFQNGGQATNFVVLNRVLPTTSRPIQFNGTVQSRIRTAQGTSAPGGTVWFYSPGGIVAGASAVFDVGSLLLSANPLTLNADNSIRSMTTLNFGAPGGVVTIETGALLLGADKAGYIAAVGSAIDKQGDVNAAGSAVFVAGSNAQIARGPDGVTLLASATASPSAATTITHAANSGQLAESGVDTILVAGNGSVNATASAGRDLIATGASGLRLGAITAGRDIALAATQGAIAGTTATAARSIGVATPGAVSFAGLTATGGSIGGTGLGSATIGQLTAGTTITLRAAGALVLGPVGAGGTADLGGSAVTLGAANVGGDLLLAATQGAIGGSTATAARNVTLSTPGAVTFASLNATNGTVSGTGLGSATIAQTRAGGAITLRSGGRLDLASLNAGGTIDLTGGTLALGTANAGSDLLLAAQGAIGGTSGTAGRNIALATPGAVTFASLTATGGVSGSRLGSAAIGSTSAGGAIALGASGGLTLTTLKAGGAIDLAAGTALVLGDATAGTNLTTAAGTDLAIGGTATAGQAMTLTANRIIVASSAAARDIDQLTDTDAIDARLGQNDRGFQAAGYLRANSLTFNVGRALYIQNSGGADSDARAGFTAGAGGVRIATTGTQPARIVINGRQGDGTTFTTGTSLIPLVSVSGGYDPRSTINGCLIANPAACLPQTPQDFFPVQDVIEQQLEQPIFGSAELNFLLPPLIQLADFTPQPSEPLIDEPVTGAANEDLWSTTTDDVSCAPGSPTGTCRR